MPNANLDKIAAEQTLELNTGHPVIVNLNLLRKKNKVAASLVARQMLDNVMIASGIPFNIQDGTERQYKMINNYLELALNHEDSPRKIDSPAQERKESALNAANRVKGKAEERIIIEEKVISEQDLKK